MKRFFPLLLSCVFLFTACNSVAGGVVQWQKSAFYSVKTGADQLYFEYPVEARISGNSVIYGQCVVDFGEVDVFELEPDKRKEVEDFVYDVWYQDADVRAYRILVREYDYYFSMSVDEGDLSGCIAFAERLADSFGEDMRYFNSKYDFSLALAKDYQVEYFEGAAGLSLEKKVVLDDPEVNDYFVEIVVLPFENIKDYDSLGDFVSAEYEGFSMEFINNDGLSGVYVDENVGDEASRHFFAMGQHKKFIFEASLRLPSVHYIKHEAEFKQMIGTLRFE